MGEEEQQYSYTASSTLYNVEICGTRLNECVDDATAE